MTQFGFEGTSSLAKNKRSKPKKKEESLQIFIANFLRLKYPGTIFNSDIASGIRLTMGQSVKAKAMRSSRGQPDLVIMEPRGAFKAMCIELKNDRSDVYLVDGTISNSKSQDHVREQADLLKRLREKGYWADFGFGRDHCMKIIDEYMAL